MTKAYELLSYTYNLVTQLPVVPWAACTAVSVIFPKLEEQPAHAD